jgi:dTMP kinase
VRGRGRFITIEGGEGAGKSTQAAHLAAWLRDTGISVLTTREPGGSPRAEVLRELLLGGRVAPFGPEAEALFFAVARAEHLAETIAPALDSDQWVISDRFMDSTRAYQGSAGVSEELLARLEAVAVGACRPDLTLILDIPAEVGLSRIRRRHGGADRFEADSLPVHEKRRRAFLEIARRAPDRCVVVDATGDATDTARSLRMAVAERLDPAGWLAGG